MRDKISKEMRAIIKAINGYQKKHKGNVCIHASFVAFEGDEADVVDDRIFMIGDEETLLISLDDMRNEIKKSPEVGRLSKELNSMYR